MNYKSDETIMRARERVETEMFQILPCTDTRIREKRDLLHGIPEELRDLLGSDDDFSALISASLPEVTFDLPELLSSTAGKRAELEAEYLLEDLFNTEVVSEAPASLLYLEAVDPNADLRGMVERTVASVVAAALAGDPAAIAFSHKDAAPSPQTATSRRAKKFVRRMAELADETGSPVASFLNAFVDGDRSGMRREVREMLGLGACR